MGDLVVERETLVERRTLLFTQRRQVWIPDPLVDYGEIVEALGMSDEMDVSRHCRSVSVCRSTYCFHHH